MQSTSAHHALIGDRNKAWDRHKSVCGNVHNAPVRDVRHDRCLRGPTCSLCLSRALQLSSCSCRCPPASPTTRAHTSPCCCGASSACCAAPCCPVCSDPFVAVLVVCSCDRGIWGGHRLVLVLLAPQAPTCHCRSRTACSMSQRKKIEQNKRACMRVTDHKTGRDITHLTSREPWLS